MNINNKYPLGLLNLVGGVAVCFLLLLTILSLGVLHSQSVSVVARVRDQLSENWTVLANTSRVREVECDEVRQSLICCVFVCLLLQRISLGELLVHTKPAVPSTVC
jgi:hypothetical protein